jgi:hypothetical protein
MNKMIILCFLLCLAGNALAKSSLHIKDTANPTILPNPFPVYTDGRSVINHPYPGFTQKLLPTNNEYRKNPGCYVVCYSRQANGAIYSVGDNIFVKGQVRVPGVYANRMCVPIHYEGKNISALSEFKNLCNRKIKSCQDCWAGGDSGGWFGIQ